MDAEIEVNIKKALPFLEESTLKSLLERLIDLGVTQSSDLKLVEVEDLKDTLKTIQARILVKCWKNLENEDKELHTQVVQPKESQAVQQKGAEQKIDEKTHHSENFDWAYDYKVSWSEMPQDIMKSLVEKKRLRPSERRKFVRIISEDISKLAPKPGRRGLSIIARKVVMTYPDSLSDTLCGEVVGEGHTSLAKQMEVRFDNLNRTNAYNMLKRSIKRKSDGEDKIKLSDAYGCVNWQPSYLPVHETQETQKEKQEIMIEKPLEKTLNDKDKQLLEDTFYSQRKDINCKNSIKYLKKNWPLLFTKDGMQLHFKMLVDVDFVEKIQESLSKKADRIYNFLKAFLPTCRKKTLDLENILESCPDTNDGDLYILLQLIALYFEENVKELFIMVDVATDVEVLDLPDTPCLVLFGDDPRIAKSFMLFIDKIAALKDIDDFFDGFSVLFMAYYCLNIHYPKSASTTLEFVQRCLLGINPINSFKKNPALKKTETVTSKILQLIIKISEYELMNS